MFALLSVGPRALLYDRRDGDLSPGTDGSLMDQQINDFLSGAVFAVVGASRDRSKYGNKVLRVYVQNGRKVHPVNPHADAVEGLKSYPDLASIPNRCTASEW